MTPFEVVYGRRVPTLRAYDPVAFTNRTEVDLALMDRDATLRRLRAHLKLAENCMKQVYDRSHREQEFDIGSWVFVRVQQY